MKYYIEQIKSRITISSIVASLIQLKHRGHSEYVGLCPFHHEKTPSFTVNDAKGFYHCFGCGEHGDVFSFLMKTEHIVYKDALTKLAASAGIILPKYNHKDDAKNKQLEDCYNIFASTAAIYHQMLFTNVGRRALQYLKARGVSEKIIRLYNLGYSPDSSDYIVQELSKRYSTEQLQQANIFIERQGILRDLMHGRIIFPIRDKKSRVIAFGGRVLGNTRYPKYLNSSENPIFEKGKILYGLDIARANILHTKAAIVVEGYIDVLALASHGITNIVAPLGTSMKLGQIEELWHLVNIPNICMDLDTAGQDAAYRIANLVLPHITPQKTVQFTMYNGGKDPAEVLKICGAQALHAAINNAVPLSEFIFKYEHDKTQLTTPEAKAAFIKKLMAIAGQIQDSTLRNEYRRHFYNATAILLRNRSTKNHINHTLVTTSTWSALGHIAKEHVHIASIFYILFKYPVLIEEDILEELWRIELPESFEHMRAKIFNILHNNSNYEAEPELQQLAYACPSIVAITQSSIDYPAIKQILMRAFRLHSLYIVQQQLQNAERELNSTYSENDLIRLFSLKQHEMALKRELRII